MASTIGKALPDGLHDWADDLLKLAVGGTGIESVTSSVSGQANQSLQTPAQALSSQNANWRQLRLAVAGAHEHCFAPRSAPTVCSQNRPMSSASDRGRSAAANPTTRRSSCSPPP